MTCLDSADMAAGDGAFGRALRTSLTPEQRTSILTAKYGPPDAVGPNVKLWHRLGYLPPDEHYERVVGSLVSATTNWLDVGCGHAVFPANPALARELAGRCRLLVGIDPDANVNRNDIVHRRVQSTIEDFKSDETFDLVTLRMVAEHITRPNELIRSLLRLTKAGSNVVIFTPNRWSPLSVAARLVPHRLHHTIKHFFWRTDEADTFPVAYRLNSRRQLDQHFSPGTFAPVLFQNLADCCATWRFPMLHRLELAVWRAAERIGVVYPENCILAVYRRTS
jgi:SAM-dependent methyltransferase